MNGCLNPNAVNYDNGATVEDFSCLYLFSDTNGNCQLFKDVLPTSIEDQSITLSYSMIGNSWVFFHDYTPDMYVHTHDALYTLKNGGVFKHNSGLAGQFYSKTPNSFFIDIIFTMEVRRKLGQVPSDQFKESGDMLLESVQWVTEFLQSNTDQPYQTLTHIAIWNSKQHTGRIKLDNVFQDLKYKYMRRTQGNWSFDTFRDLLQANGSAFLLDIFEDYALDVTQVPQHIPWYNKKMLQDQWFCVRFEFDNTSGQQLLLHDMIIQAIKTDR